MIDSTPACAHCKVVLKHAQNKVTLPGHTYPSTLISDYWECADRCGKRFYPADSSGLLALALRLNDGHEWPISHAIRQFYSIQAQSPADKKPEIVTNTTTEHQPATEPSSQDQSRWFTISMIEGHIAMWAVRQSPYHCPADLPAVLARFRDSSRTNIFDDDKMFRSDRMGIQYILDSHLFNQPAVASWNERKNGRQGHGFVCRFDGTRNPDDDFIDLGALKTNIIRSLFDECAKDDARPVTASCPESSLLAFGAAHCPNPTEPSNPDQKA